ncbi:hypothetical protein Pmar_PMAR022578 [Perkinsus marinus ATCC 50983]|uniref:Ca(2+)-dependent cysteine protease n=1 Tax=Perkinsus marinus (strain ATCC 50983 / TXsc) TaxID=423536 RepID=C5KFI2_PERM5|nr:hypothetical protein Pmar_PMAR022578 [Perkinsus marinus ATCC 50983]EER16731.1 hypothetical protein Pmar_PMAR022578 [Perkinsus marinus ATCC 50983]|eukprot:XP_002784935.1 hypothetical protein Pmar_PMAR022578 [Perkinsus marinus ATCC 50983]
MSRPFTDADLRAVEELCPTSSTSDVELALWRANGDRNMAANMLLSQQRSTPAAQAYPSQPVPVVAVAQAAPREQVERSAQIRCCHCEELMTVNVRGFRDEAVGAEAQCPRCHQMNRFVLPAEKDSVVASEAAPFKPYSVEIPTNSEAFDAAHAPPVTPQGAMPVPTVEVPPSQVALPQNMQVQVVQIENLWGNYAN